MSVAFASVAAHAPLTASPPASFLFSLRGSSSSGSRSAAGEKSSGAHSSCAKVLAAAVVVVGLRAKRSSGRAGRSEAGSRAVALQAAAGKIETFLIPGPVNASKLALAVAPLAAHIDLACLAFFSLGVPADLIASVAGGSLGIHGLCPVYIADCYGIIGWDKKEGRNVELMEKGVGQEYGKAGGQGGEGVVVVAFRGLKTHASSESLPGSGGLHLVVTAHGKEDLHGADKGVSYGGYAKACYKLEHSGDVVPVSQFVISSQSEEAAAVSSFDADADKASAATLAALGNKPVSVAGYIPCFCRGFNKYGEDGVEPAAIASTAGLESVRLFGMFAHGELGPAKGSPAIASQEGTSAQEIHTETSVLALYGS